MNISIVDPLAISKEELCCISFVHNWKTRQLLFASAFQDVQFPCESAFPSMSKCQMYALIGLFFNL